MQYEDMTVDEIENLLRQVLGPKLQEVLDLVRSDPSEYLVQIPTSDSMDTLSLEELGSLVARASNAYGRIARLSGMANAEYKLAKGRYDRKFKTGNYEGKNAEERRANAMAAAEEEHMAVSVAESLVAMLGPLEDGARIASESARKLYDKVGAMQVAYGRESHGHLQDKDYSRVQSRPREEVKPDYKADRITSIEDIKW